MHNARRVGGEQRTADFLDEPADPRHAEWPVIDHRGERRAPEEESKDEVGAPWFAPVIVKRNDVRMLEPRHELGLGLEPLNELRVIGEVRADRLDRDLSIGAWLRRREHPTRGAFAEHLVNRVAAQQPGS